MSQQHLSPEREFYFDIDTDIIRPNKTTMRKHCHNHFEIYFITKGNCCYFIENNVYHLIPGDIILIPEGIMHNTEYQNTAYTRKLISCSEHFIPERIKPFLPSLLYLYRNPDIVERVDQIFNNIEAEYAQKDSFSEDIFQCYTHLLFFLLARHPNHFVSQQAEKNYIEDAITFLQKNYTRQITLQEISSRYYVSPEHFSRLFKQKTGFNVSEYLNILRLQKAENLLKQLTAAPITEIAEDCGFNDSNYFSVKFKNLYGMSPKKFQTMHKNRVNTSKQEDQKIDTK